MPKIKMLKEDNVRRGFFERAEFEKVREALPESLRPMVTLAYYTGWRREELLSLQWRQVDLEAGTVTLDTSKNGEGRTFVFDGLTEVQTMFEAQRNLPFVTPYVFHRRGKPIKSFGKAGDRVHDREGARPVDARLPAHRRPEYGSARRAGEGRDDD